MGIGAAVVLEVLSVPVPDAVVTPVRRKLPRSSVPPDAIVRVAETARSADAVLVPDELLLLSEVYVPSTIVCPPVLLL